MICFSGISLWSLSLSRFVSCNWAVFRMLILELRYRQISFVLCDWAVFIRLMPMLRYRQISFVSCDWVYKIGASASISTDLFHVIIAAFFGSFQYGRHCFDFEFRRLISLRDGQLYLWNFSPERFFKGFILCFGYIGNLLPVMWLLRFLRGFFNTAVIVSILHFGDCFYLLLVTISSWIFNVVILKVLHQCSNMACVINSAMN